MQFERLLHQINLNVYSRKTCLFFVLAIFLSGCSHDPMMVEVKDLRAPPRVTSGDHIVRKGETLASIAWLYSRDFRELAVHNEIPSPYIIYPGQHIDLTFNASASSSAKRSGVTRNSALSPSEKKMVVKKTTARKPIKTAPGNGSLTWVWPANGNIVRSSSGGSGLNKGIDILAQLGEPVRAATQGEVVYSGSELAGYGKLIIIKHNDSYLSAYAHNRDILVQEGDAVKAGQMIAEIGSTGTTEPKLYFEIRRYGEPVDPLRFLPSR